MSETERPASFDNSRRTIRVLLADDHPALRIGLRVLLEQEPEMEVVGEASDGKEASEQIKALRPDVAVLDCRLPDVEGAQVASEVRRLCPSTRVLAISAYRDERHVRNMLAAGAVGYLLKEEAPRTIVAAVQATARGERWFSPEVASKAAAWERRERVEQRDLTVRELDVLRLIADGRSNKEIAQILSVSDRTIEFHVSNILNKLGFVSRVEAAVWANSNGL